jgi:hypothetical protein
VKLNMKIDFVVTWVDTEDEAWLAEFQKYHNSEKYINVADLTKSRYREIIDFRYWFRAIENCAEWVNKIHLITNGKFPEWINKEHPKLNCVAHSDYINEKYLPTFNSRVIELNLGNLNELSEHFVLFNDDFYLLNKVNESEYFLDDLPRDAAILNALDGDGLSPVIMNSIKLLNESYTKHDILKKNLLKWYSLKYKKDLIRTILLTPWPRFTGFVDFHTPQPFLKSFFNKASVRFSENMSTTFESRFRLKSDVNQYLIRYMQLCEGSFKPSYPKNKCNYFELNDNNILDIADVLINKKVDTLIVNDGKIKNIDNARKILNDAFEKIYNKKSAFEMK